MNGLIYKDAVNLKSYSKTLIPILILMGTMTFLNKMVMLLIGYAIIMCISLTIATFSYDENVKWDCYALTLPIDRKDIVRSKYVFYYILTAMMSFVCLIMIMLLGYLEYQSLFYEDYLISLIVMVAISLIYMMILFPLLFKYGAEKARYALISLAVVPILIGFIGSTGIIPTDSIIVMIETLFNSPASSIIILIVLLFAINGISYLISLKIIEKKEY